MSTPKSVRITRTVEYTPEAYLEFCNEGGQDGKPPSQEGFLEFIGDWIDEDFRNGFGQQVITEIEGEDA